MAGGKLQSSRKLSQFTHKWFWIIGKWLNCLNGDERENRIEFALEWRKAIVELCSATKRNQIDGEIRHNSQILMKTSMTNDYEWWKGKAERKAIKSFSGILWVFQCIIVSMQIDLVAIKKTRSRGRYLMVIVSSRWSFLSWIEHMYLRMPKKELKNVPETFPVFRKRLVDDFVTFYLLSCGFDALTLSPDVAVE